MSAAVAHHQPEQLAFLPPATPLTVGVDLAEPGADKSAQCLACSGLVKHAEVRISTDHLPHLVVQILHPKDALPFVAVFHGQAPADAWQLRAMAERLMRPGAVALLRGHGGLRLKTGPDGPALHLGVCTGVLELDVDELPHQGGAHVSA